MKRPPTRLAVARRRVKQLEQCLDDLGRILALRDREMCAYGCAGPDVSEYRLIAQLTRRIGRTVQPQTPTTHHENHP